MRLMIFLWVAAIPLLASDSKSDLKMFLDREVTGLQSFYTDLHRNPELSLLEEKTGARIAEQLRKAGLEVTEKVGGYGVVAVLGNGTGPTVLLRTDLDALPVKEQTGLAYASERTQKNTSGEEVPVMHACGHDMHMTVLVGAARFLAAHTNLFRGTLVFIGQPAEERGVGARAMLKDGLFEKFPKPNYCLALHVDSTRRAGEVSYVSGYMMANVDAIDLTIKGEGGHGAYPHKAKDPIVLAAETILAFQTLISREKEAIDPGVLTVGSIHGGTKHNIIPDEVKLQLTLRSYSDKVRNDLIAGVKRVSRGMALAAGLPEDRMPVVHVREEEYTPATYNDPDLTQRWVDALTSWIGTEHIHQDKPQMGGEDFSLYGRTADKIPICMLWLGSVPAKNLQAPPGIHSALYYPDPDPTIRTGITAFTAAVLDLMKP